MVGGRDMTYAECASELGISPQAAHYYAEQIKDKVGGRSPRLAVSQVYASLKWQFDL